MLLVGNGPSDGYVEGGRRNPPAHRCARGGQGECLQSRPLSLDWRGGQWVIKRLYLVFGGWFDVQSFRQLQRSIMNYAVLYC